MQRDSSLKNEKCATMIFYFSAEHTRKCFAKIPGRSFPCNYNECELNAFKPQEGCRITHKSIHMTHMLISLRKPYELKFWANSRTGKKSLRSVLWIGSIKNPNSSQMTTFLIKSKGRCQNDEWMKTFRPAPCTFALIWLQQTWNIVWFLWWVCIHFEVQHLQSPFIAIAKKILFFFKCYPLNPTKLSSHWCLLLYPGL